MGSGDMKNNDQNIQAQDQPSLDRITSQLTAKWGQRGSRRGFLTQLGKMVLVAVGGSFGAALPSDRRIAEASFGNNNCDQWYWCGMNGRPCASCGGTDTTCPHSGCNTAGHAWVACCNGPSGCDKIVYYDCCATGSGHCPAVNCSKSCHRKDLAGWWCNGGNSSNYRCTLAVISGTCGGPC